LHLPTPAHACTPTPNPQVNYPDIGFALLTASAGKLTRVGDNALFDSPYDAECANRIFFDRSGGFAPKMAHSVQLAVPCSRESSCVAMKGR